MSAFLLRLFLVLLCLCSTRSAVSLLHLLPALPPPLPSLRCIPPAAPRSLPARSGTRESLPENHCVPETQSSHRLAIFQGLPSGTSALLLPQQMDPAQNAPPSTQPDSNILVLL